MRVEASKIVSDLKLKPGVKVLLFGEVEPKILVSVAEAAGGFENLLLLHRDAKPPQGARGFIEKGMKAQRSSLIEHNDFLPSSSFEAVLAQNVINKLLGRREFLGESYRLLKPGGRLAIIQRLWPLTDLRKKEFDNLINGARSFSKVESRIGLFSTYVVLERPT
ncbi:MAG: methyltransferase domain-containing protein [Nitrososphaerota archaeon]